MQNPPVAEPAPSPPVLSPGRFLRTCAAFAAGCLACVALRRYAGADTVTAASVAGLAGTFLPVPKGFGRGETQAVFYAGAFAGTCAVQSISGYAAVTFVSLLGAAVFLLVKPRFRGVGGKLGATAFVATAAWLVLTEACG